MPLYPSIELRMRNRLAYVGRSRLLQCVLHFPPLECPSRKEDSSVGGLSLFLLLLLVSQGSLLLLAPERDSSLLIFFWCPFLLLARPKGKKSKPGRFFFLLLFGRGRKLKGIGESWVFCFGRKKRREKIRRREILREIS